MLQGLRAGEADALNRFQRHHPGRPNAGGLLPPDHPARLSDAQLVIARELGLPSWPRLKAHIETIDQSWTRIQRGDAAPDRGAATLHIRCGSDIGPGLKPAGFIGDFLEYSDPLCQGPVLDGPDWLVQRAAFIVQAYGSNVDHEAIGSRLRQVEEALHHAGAGMTPGSRL